MLCVEDYLDALQWGEQIGGLPALMARADANARTLNDWVDRTAWIANLANDPATRSNTSVCLKIVAPEIAALDDAAQAAFCKALVKRLAEADVAYDIDAYRDAPPGLRIWTGATVDAADIAVLTEWLDWAFAAEIAKRGNAVRHDVAPDTGRLVAEIGAFLWHNELPVDSASQYAQWCVFRLAAEAGVTVLLDGYRAKLDRSTASLAHLDAANHLR